jgi:hypothetical protein
MVDPKDQATSQTLTKPYVGLVLRPVNTCWLGGTMSWRSYCSGETFFASAVGSIFLHMGDDRREKEAA